MKAHFYTDILHGVRLAAIVAVSAILSVFNVSCDHSDLWNEVPGEIGQFINTYYPNSVLEAVTHSGDIYHVRIDDGPGLAFDSEYKWIDINGYGMPLPQVLLFDQLPPRLYEYLQGTEQLNAVFSMSRDDDVYTLTLLKSSLRFDVSTGKLTGSDFS